MIKLFKKYEPKTTQYHSITFRVDSDDKTKLSQQADEFNISLSEYVRSKALIEDGDLQSILNENTILKNKIKGYENQVESKASNTIDPGIILIQSTEEGKEILKKVLSEISWNRFDYEPGIIENDIQLAKAIGFLLIEQIIEPLGKLPELREKYNLEKVEELFERLLVFDTD